MLTFFKINSEQDSEWDDNPNDLSIFIVIIASVQHEFGLSTYIVANRKHQKVVTSKFNVLGCSTMKVVSQFDVNLETSISYLKEGMPVVVLNALKAFIEAKRARPFLCADLKRVMEGAEIARITSAQEEEGTSGSGHATPSPQKGTC